MPRPATGIGQRHGNGCNGKGRCDCPWQASVYSPRDGKKIRKAFPTKAAAVAWREEKKPAVRKGELRAPTSTTLKEASDAWLAGARAGTILPRSRRPYKPNTIRGYERAMRLHVLPELGSRRLCDIDRERLQEFVNELISNGTAPSLIHHTISPVRCIYRQAVRRGEVAVNPTAGLELPACRPSRDRVAPPDECAKLLAALPRRRDRAVWATAMYAGLRRGELMALRVEDVDLAAGVIHVRRGWDQHEGEITTKSDRERNVPISGALRDHLDEHLLSLAWRDEPEALVFGTTATRPFVPVTLTARADVAWKRAKLERIKLHECRHTFASLMIAAGVNVKALSTYMGHATISITLDLYGHLMPGNEAEAASLLDAYLERADSQARIAQIAA